MKWVGDAPKGYADHLASHYGSTHSWMFVCALCAGQMDNEEDILHHLVNNHLSDLTTLLISTIKQGRSVLLPVLQSLAADIEEQSDDYSLHFPAARSRKTSPQSSSSELTPPLPTPPIIKDE